MRKFLKSPFLLYKNCLLETIKASDGLLVTFLKGKRLAFFGMIILTKKHIFSTPLLLNRNIHYAYVEICRKIVYEKVVNISTIVIKFYLYNYQIKANHLKGWDAKLQV